MAQALTVVTEQNPWPWLDPFGEEAQRFFHGRDEDVAALLRMVRGAPVTVLFGKSGLGKTSLLQAGLFPALRNERLMPVYVRLRHGPGAGALQQQLWAAFAAQCDARGMTYSPASEEAVQAANDHFWLYVHRRPPGLRNANGEAMQPVFVLDQFEEYFTLGAADAVQQERMFAALGDLLENRVPRAVATLLEHDDAILDHHDLDTQSYKFLVSLREDYLPDLELWCDEIPRLGPNRYRLLPMGRAQALEAIVKTGGALVSDSKAGQIVDYLTRNDSAPAPRRRGRQAGDIQVEPALLSLVCSGLNANRIRTGAAQLDTQNLEHRGGEIIEQFYDERLKAMPQAVHRLIERELITPDGIRLQYPTQSATAQGNITQAQLDELVSQRILRKESSAETQRIELVHDRLAAVALGRRRASEQREAAAVQQVKADELERLAAARRKAQRYLWLATAAVLVLSLGAFLLYDAYQARNEAQLATARAQEAADVAKKRSDEAVAAQREAESALARVRRLDADHKVYEAAINANPVLAKTIASRETGKTLVYLQVPRAGDASAARRLQTQLQEHGYDSPPLERINVAPKAFELRYFRAADKDEAAKLATLMQQWNYGGIQVKSVAGYESRSRLKQLEIWFPQREKSVLARLVDQIDNAPADERKQAIQTLWGSYRASPEAVAEVLDLYQAERINTLTANGMINGVRFLASTGAKAWNPLLEKNARDAIAAIEAKNPGPNTLEQAQKLKGLLDGLPGARAGKDK
jgi:hypothetical protein